MKRRTTVVLVLGLTLMLSTAAWSRPFNGGFPGPGMDRHHFPENMLMILDLDNAQKTRAAKIVARYRKLERDLVRDSQGMHRRMDAVLFAEPFDEAAAREIFRDNAAVHEELMVLKGRMISEIRALLTPEQLSELQAMRAKRMKAHSRHAEFKSLVEDSMAVRE